MSDKHQVLGSAANRALFTRAVLAFATLDAVDRRWLIARLTDDHDQLLRQERDARRQGQVVGESDA